MGRKKIEIDRNRIYDMAAQGMTQKQMAKEFGVSRPTLMRRLAELRFKQSMLADYKALQSLHLTELQARVIEAITPERIADASLVELVKAVGILKKLELSIEGKPSKITSLVTYLEELDREERESP